jgi:ankyrin repeat protein
MSIPFFDPLRTLLLRLRYFVPVLIAALAAALLPPLGAAVLLLLADALAMAAVSRVAALDPQHSYAQTLRLGMPAFLLLLFAYALLLLLLTVYPLQWLLRDRSLFATLAVSTEVVVALLCLWRLWPVFGLVFVRKGTGAPAAAPTSILATLRRATNLAYATSGQNELFFSHGLVVSFCVLLMAAAAIAVGGSDLWPVTPGMRSLLVVACGGVGAPLIAALILNRCADALVIELQRQRRDRDRDRDARARSTAAAPATPTPVVEAAPLEPDDLDARLLRCVRSGQTELALTALARGANPHTVPGAGERDQRSVLVLATLAPDMRLLRHLIAKGADLNRVHAGLTPLLAATRDSHQGRPDAVMTLLTNGADPRCADAAGNTALHYAALSATPIVSALLCDAAAPLDAVNRDGLTPLAMACAAGNWTLVRFLLDRGARLEVARAQPALLGAAGVSDDDPGGVELLLKRKANVNARDALGRSALMIAALQGNGAIAEILIDAGADVSLTDHRGTTALMEAARAGALAVLDLILARAPDLDAVDASGRSALTIACQSRQAGEAIVRRLLDAGAARDLAAADGRRSVDFAASAGRWHLVALLDPAYPLPASVAELAAAPAPDPDSPQHLLDALRFANWHIVETFAERVREWPAAELTALHLALAEHEPAAARLWLIDHGTQRLARDAAGDVLLAELLQRLPATGAAATEWFAAGASPSGGRHLARICAALALSDGEARLRMERLALASIDAGADLFGADADGRSPLAHAVSAGSSVVAQALLERGVDADSRDRRGRTPLFEALALALEPALALVTLLLRAGANPEVAAITGETPLGLALARPEAQLRARLNWPHWRLPLRRLRGSDLPAAAAAGDLDAVTKLLELGLPLDATDARGADALLRAAGCGHAHLVEALLQRGADPGRAAPSGATALSAAVTARREDVVAALLKHGVAVDQRLPAGATALMVAAALGFPEIAARLLAAGADVDARDERGTRALHAAAQQAFRSADTEGMRRLFDLLLRHGADVNAANAAGQTPLLLLLGGSAEPGGAADQKHLLALLPLFLLAHADVNVQDLRGVGALHACAMHGLLLPLRALLAARADPSRCDVLERTPRQVAQLLGYVDVAAELAARELPVQATSDGDA